MDPRSMKTPPAPAAPAANNKQPDKANPTAIDPMKRLEELETVVLQSEETIDNMALAVKEIGQENEVMRKRLREILEVEEPKRPWNWKRILWATVSSGGGLALAFFLRKRQPIINHAASASLGMMAFERIKPLRGVKHLGGAITGLGSRWAHDNFEALEVGMAGAAYSYATFQLGEMSVEGFKVGRKFGAEAFERLKARVQKARGEAGKTETEEELDHATE